MFEDRSKSKYDFKKMDSNARTQVLLENSAKKNNMTDAQKKLFSVEQQSSQTEHILHKHQNVNVSNLPSSKYLQSFSKDMTVGEAETISQNNEKEIKEVVLEDNLQQLETGINFEHLIEDAHELKIDEKQIKKELNNIAPSPKKNYSFRIKLVAGVYCILVALFGGWVIGNSIDIANTNSYIYEATTTTENLNVNITKILLEIKKYDNVTEDPKDDGLLLEMATEIIPIVPEATIEPNEYNVESNWFDKFCNWLAKIFWGN